ncbi:MAG TPA: metallophosphoesterase [Candidatus Atribacteria bacterium]|nr:metallophosphoesterase [Candidatus Atribacteria bacterium]HPT79290.1 metallophosphoesterase [Candidatus Atribacteria bacterium]
MKLSTAYKKSIGTKEAGRVTMLIVTILFCAALLACFCYYQNNALQVSRIRLTSAKIKDEVSIVHLSDLHGKSFGRSNELLIRMVADLDPNFIVYTGDLISSRRDMDKSVQTLNRLANEAPVYYIPGNHEYRFVLRDVLYEKLGQAGIKLLRNQTESICINETSLTILGLDYQALEPLDKEKLLGDLAKADSYNIVLDHFPENFPDLAADGIDLVLAGHAHGGQFILPLIGGVFAPGQGFDPRYYSGRYSLESSDMIVSRGLGNSAFPLRLFNRPEIVFISLVPET